MDRIRLNFIGTSNQALSRAPCCVEPIAAEAGLAASVSETPQRVPYLQALALLAQSNVLMMIGSDEPHYTASKIYPNLMAGRPFLSLFHERSSSHDILVRAGGGISISFCDLPHLATLAPKIAEAFASLTRHPEAYSSPNADVYDAYSASCAAKRFAEVFEKATLTPRSRIIARR